MCMHEGMQESGSCCWEKRLVFREALQIEHHQHGSCIWERRPCCRPGCAAIGRPPGEAPAFSGQH